MKHTFSKTVVLLICTILLITPGAAQELLKKQENLKTLPRVERWETVKKLINSLNKAQQQDDRHDDRKETIVNGNQITVLLTNQGSISTPNADNANADLVWPAGPSGLGYSYEFGPLVAAEVFSDAGDTLHIVNDGFLLQSDGDFEPGTTNRWGWEPRIGFSDPRSNEVATFSDLDRDLDGKPDSWPEAWFNDVLGRYVWPAFLGDDATTPDEEVFYVMDDFDNAEFEYFPDPADSTIRGMGLELQVRIFQFNNPLAEDIIFLVYTITNVSPREINNVHLGMFGDPHVGGPGDFSDDNAGFISKFNEEFPPNVRNMLFAFDADMRGDLGKIPGYFGYRFLESPGIDNDGVDNDNDGIVDESQTNDAGVFEFDPVLDKFRWSGDEDGDWDAEFDDVGVDGIDGTGDFGEGDGKPNQLYYLDLNGNAMLDAGEPTAENRLEGYRFFGGEPNFGFLDIAESDQLGLTSFNAILFGGNNRPKNDELMWDLMSAPNQRPEDPEPEIEQEADNVFIYGSGPFTLKPGESQRFSIALMMGVDFEDLLSNAAISQQVFEADYRFAQAPDKPKLVAVPGDNKVTLYWDTGAEASFDPFVARANPEEPEKGFDFEGYRIYRSRDFSFNDTQTITDSRGVPFLSVPLRQVNGLPAQFDLINEFEGLSDIEYLGRGVRYDLGRNTSLVHAYVDSNNVENGVTYFYAVTSYDHGDVNAILAPSESQRVIQRDAVTREFAFDVNTASVVPGAEASGFVSAGLAGTEGNMATQVTGNATGQVWIDFLDPLAVQDAYQYDIVFQESEIDSGIIDTTYSVVNRQEQSVEFQSRGTSFVNLLRGESQIAVGSETVFEDNGSTVDTSRYEMDYQSARIRGTSQNSLPVNDIFSVTFTEVPVGQSVAKNSEDSNPVFDGMRVFVQNEKTALDPLSTEGGRSGFKIIETNTNFSDENTAIDLAGVGAPRPFPSDFEIRFTDYDTTAAGDLVSPADSAVLTNVRTNFRIVDTENGNRIDFFIQEVAGLRNGRWDWQEPIFLIRPEASQVTQTTYEVMFSPPGDTLENGQVVFDQPIYPGAGDVFLFFSSKPFKPGDEFTFTTEAVTYDNATEKAALDDIIVVPNPYVSFSAAEIAGVRTGDRDDRRIEFRNLPRECTIRIYTVVGELVDTIEKNDSRDFATWDLLTFESQQLAYGVYIYHVDAPGIGTKIGRFGVIK